MQEVLQLQPELEGFKEQGLDFYFVIAGRERELRAFFERYPVVANVVWDQELEIFWDYDVEGLPVSFFVDKMVWCGRRNWVGIRILQQSSRSWWISWWRSRSTCLFFG